MERTRTFTTAAVLEAATDTHYCPSLLPMLVFPYLYLPQEAYLGRGVQTSLWLSYLPTFQ